MNDEYDFSKGVRGKFFDPEAEFVIPDKDRDGEKKVVQRTLNERFKKIIGRAPDLPEDMAENHDHYIHGTTRH